MSAIELFVDGIRSAADSMDVQAIYAFKYGYTIQDIDIMWARELCLWYDDDCTIDNLIDMRYAAGAQHPHTIKHCRFPEQSEVDEIPGLMWNRFTWDERHELYNYLIGHARIGWFEWTCDCGFQGDQYKLIDHMIEEHGVLDDKENSMRKV